MAVGLSRRHTSAICSQPEPLKQLSTSLFMMIFPFQAAQR